MTVSCRCSNSCSMVVWGHRLPRGSSGSMPQIRVCKQKNLKKQKLLGCPRKLSTPKQHCNALLTSSRDSKGSCRSRATGVQECPSHHASLQRAGRQHPEGNAAPMPWQKQFRVAFNFERASSSLDALFRKSGSIFRSAYCSLDALFQKRLCIPCGLQRH